MRAATFRGPGEIAVEDVPKPEIEAPTDAIVRVTHTAVCGSDLWFYRGETDREVGSRVGHEPMGIVEAVGDAVTSVTPGDRVFAPFDLTGEAEVAWIEEGAFTVDEPIAGLDAGLGGWRALDWGDDLNEAVLHADLDTEAAKLAACSRLEVLVLVSVQIG